DDKTRTLYCLRLGQMLQASTSFVPHGSTTPFDRMGIAEYFPVGYIQPTIRGPKRRVVGPRLRTSRPPVCRPLRSRRCTVICRETTLMGSINWLQALGELPCLLAREFVR